MLGNLDDKVTLSRYAESCEIVIKSFIWSRGLIMKQFLKIILLFLTIFFSSNVYSEQKFQGQMSPIPLQIQKLMTNHTWHAGCPIALKDLSYLQISYWGFDNKVHQGEMIVNKEVAAEVIEIFKQLFASHFSIQQMKIPEHLNGSEKFTKPFDLLLFAVNNNNTYAFFCRQDAQSPEKFSAHS